MPTDYVTCGNLDRDNSFIRAHFVNPDFAMPFNDRYLAVHHIGSQVHVKQRTEEL